MRMNYDPDIGDEYPAEVRRFSDRGYVREIEESSDGTVFSDDTHVFALIGPGVTYIGDGDPSNHLQIDPEDVEYDRAEWVELSNGDTVKLWIFDHGDRQIAFKWKYIELARDVFDISLDEIRGIAAAAGDTEADDEEPAPLLIESPDHEYRAIIMPHRSRSG